MDFLCCAVASGPFSAHARVLADSFFEHHPDGRFAVLTPDDPDQRFSLGDRVEVLRPRDVGVDEAELARMALMYSVKELACALKARMVRQFVERVEVVVMLDGDMCIYGELTRVAESARREGLVISPHCTTPHETPDHYPPMLGHAPRMVNALGADQMMVLAGTYNSGLLAVSPSAVPFLEWWTARTARYCRLEPQRGLFQEQSWLALVPTLFPCGILREPGWNVSGFHLHDGDVTWEGDRPHIEGAPLRCFHFITFDPAVPDQLSSEPHIQGIWPPPADRPGAVRVCRDYAARLRAAGHEAARARRSPFERLPDGTPIDVYMRTAYAEALLQHEAGRAAEPPNPFVDGDSQGFLDWLAQPAAAGSGHPALSRHLLAVHTARAWVWGSFKEVPGRDTERFLAWLPTAVEMGHLELPEWALPKEPVPAPVDPAMAELQEQYRDLLRTLETQRASRSWRLTAPLRRAGALLRRGEG